MAILLLLIFGSIVGYGVAYFLSFMTRNADEADERRRRYFLKKTRQIIPDSIEYQMEWTPNSRGLLLVRHQYIPATKPMKGVIGICHGFGDHSQDFLTDLALKFCESGYAVLAMDAEGHGLSDGLHGHVTDMQHLVSDYSDYFMAQLQREIFSNKPFFLFGESMGGAIVFNLCTQSTLQSSVRGVVMLAPMVGIAPELMLPPAVMTILRALASLIPLAPITPIPDIVEKCFKDPSGLLRTRQDILGYQRKPRLQAALVMLETTEDISRRLHEMNKPLFLLHGEDDVVTCPKLSTQFFNSCQSDDKTLTIYPKGCHGLLRGEFPDRIEEIYRDVEKWLLERS